MVAWTISSKSQKIKVPSAAGKFTITYFYNSNNSLNKLYVDLPLVNGSLTLYVNDFISLYLAKKKTQSGIIEGTFHLDNTDI
jgi:hypothetical protein